MRLLSSFSRGSAGRKRKQALEALEQEQATQREQTEKALQGSITVGTAELSRMRAEFEQEAAQERHVIERERAALEEDRTKRKQAAKRQH